MIPPPRLPSSRRVVVVGGGLAGIGAALGLADAGADVVLVERRAFLGGLTSSITRNGLSFDNGQHVFLRCCTAYTAFLKRLGAEGSVYLQPRLDVPVLAPGGARSRLKRTWLPAPLHLAASLAAYRHLKPADRARIGLAALPLRRLDPDDPRLDEVSFGHWLRGKGQSPQAIERLWNLIALPTLNVPADEASLALATRVFRLGLLDSADGGDIGWSRVPLAQLHGVNAARALDAAGVTTVLGAQVTTVDRPGGHQFEVIAAGRRLPAEAVVVATPPKVAANLLAGVLEQDAARQRHGPERRATVEGMCGAVISLETAERLGASPIVNVHLVLDRPVTDLPMAACVGSPIQFVFDRTGPSGARSGQCLGISLSAADSYVARGSADLVASFFEALGEIFPAARKARLVDGVVTRERCATFRASVGSRSYRPTERTAVPGLFLAGAWCATGWPATMEGALRSGAKAADGVLHLLGNREWPAVGRESQLEEAAS
ncbi:MAG: hydroxysqualene dehydroxylase HpnE [Acidimicrobiales bacterium]